MFSKTKAAAFGAIALSVMATVATIFSPVTTVAATSSTYVALGADLTAEQKATVLSLLEVDGSDLTEDNTVTVTNAEEHEYLDNYLASSVIGTKALSSAKVTPASSGSGIQVTTKNINYITEEMYENALATAGMQNANVVVAAPTSISGTAGLIGAMKAYSQMTGQVIEPTVIETASAELVTSGEIAESTGDAETTAELIAAVKQVVAENDLSDEDDIRSAIEDVAAQLGITLSEEDIDRLIDLMKQLSALDLDANDLAEQAKSVYEAVSAKGLDLSKYGISEEEVNNFFSKLPQLFQALLDWLHGIFGNSQ